MSTSGSALATAPQALARIPLLRLPRDVPGQEPRDDEGGDGERGCPCGTDVAVRWSVASRDDPDRPDAPGPGDLVPPHDPTARVLLRWMLGHHAAFLVWRGTALRELACTGARTPPPGRLRAEAACLDAYSALLLYAASVPPDVYAAVVRPAMAAAHPAFSGRWAREHGPLHDLLARVRERYPADALTELLHAHRVNRQTHVLVARRLVPEGGSLFTDIGHSATSPVTEREQDVFDRFFRVERGPTCTDLLDRQRGSVLGRVAVDLCLHPLALTDDDRADVPPAVLPRIEQLSADPVSVLGELARRPVPPAPPGGTP